MNNFDSVNDLVDGFTTDPIMERQILRPDMESLLDEYENGKQLGETTHAKTLDGVISWKRTFVNCWTGWPNFGKSTFTKYIALLKSYKAGWKWVLFVPEDVGSHRMPNGKIKVDANDVWDELAFTYQGQTPYKHHHEKKGWARMERDVYIETMKWLEAHFMIVQPDNRSWNGLIDLIKYSYDHRPFDGIFIDPFKNIRSDEKGRTDLYLDETFAALKDVAIETNSSVNIVAHPKNEKKKITSGQNEGEYKVVEPDMMLGGASWDNNMDGFYSFHRPFKHDDPKSPWCELFNLKQRKQTLVGKPGSVGDIFFVEKMNRFLFDKRDPFTGQTHELNQKAPF